jgi:thiamine pyrophosphate-dependent acetolactate synthase large subunit-like protein
VVFRFLTATHPRLGFDQATEPEATAARVLTAVERPGPALVEVLTPSDDVLPVVPAGRSNAEMSGIDGTL